MRGDEAGFDRGEGVWWSVSRCGDGDVGPVSEGDGGGLSRGERGRKEEGRRRLESRIYNASKASVPIRFGVVPHV